MTNNNILLFEYLFCIEGPQLQSDLKSLASHQLWVWIPSETKFHMWENIIHQAGALIPNTDLVWEFCIYIYVCMYGFFNILEDI